MRASMAFLGALCAPMAYVTLRKMGQSAPTAILAALLIAFGKLLNALYRPIVFFTGVDAVQL